MVTSWLVDPCCFRIAYINAKMIGYRPWLVPGCVYHKNGEINVAEVIDPGCFLVAYTGIREPVSVIKFYTVKLTTLIR